jgi:ATP-dependent RNA helicase DeaD
VNYDVPSAPEAYVHRIGRVGRAGREGVAITLAEPREHRQLKTIERVAGAPITVEKVPTVADLRNRRLELTRAALRESLLTDDLDRFRGVVEILSDEFDLMEVALAAVKLAHEAGGAADDDEEIPQVSFRTDKDAARGPAARGSTQRGTAERGTGRSDGPARRDRRPGCSSGPAGTPASGRATSSARSPARPA